MGERKAGRKGGSGAGGKARPRKGGSDCNRFADVFYFSPSTAV